MAESYLTTDIIVIIVLVVVLVLIGMAAFFIHFYWTKMGVAEVWNTSKWSSIRSSFYRTVDRISGVKTSRFSYEQPLHRESITSYNFNAGLPSFPDNQRRAQPVKSNYPHPSSTNRSNHHLQEPISIIPYPNSALSNSMKLPARESQNRNINYINERQDLASMIQKQRF